jgi:hypothetical protein
MCLKSVQDIGEKKNLFLVPEMDVVCYKISLIESRANL